MEASIRRLGVALALCGSLGASVASAADVPTSRFLAPADLDPALVLPPPPADGSDAARSELAELHNIQNARTPERLAQARRDDALEDVRAIADVLPDFDIARLPATAKVFADLRNEDSVAAKRAKAFFGRTRPWAIDGSLVPCDKGDVVKTSYPSGHATMGYAAASLLAQLVPDRAQLVLARAADYAESRLVCGVHYRRDVNAGAVLGSVLVLKLMEKPAFRVEVEAARAELRAAKIAP